jgi:hypothetical protein
MNESATRVNVPALQAYVREITEAAARAAEILQTLAPLRARFDGLDAAIAAYVQACGGEEQPAPPARAPQPKVFPATAPRADASVTTVPFESAPPVAVTNGPAALARVDGGSLLAPADASRSLVEPSGPAPVVAPEEDAEAGRDRPSPTDEPAVPEPDQVGVVGTEGGVTVTVTRHDAPLDLVRVHGAFDGIEGVASLALVSYTRGRAVLQLDTDQPLDDLALERGLRAAFPEGVSTRRHGPNDVAVSIGA